MAVVKLEREVAGVVVDANVIFNRIGIEFFTLTPSKKAFKEGEGFFGVFEVTERLGFKSEVEVFTRFFGEGLDGKSAGIKVCENEVFVGFKFLKGTWES